MTPTTTTSLATSSTPAALASDFTVLALRSPAARRVLLAGALATIATLAARAHHAALVLRIRTRPFGLAEVARADRLVEAAGVLDVLIAVAALWALARWTGRLYDCARAMEVRDLGYTPGQARWSYGLPGLHSVRPLRALRRLARKIERHDLPEPAPRARGDVDSASGYRDNAVVAIPPPVAGPRAPIWTFWTAWLLAQALGRAGDLAAQRAGDARGILLASGLDLGAGALTVTALLLGARVIRGLDAAVREYHRRWRFAAA